MGTSLNHIGIAISSESLERLQELYGILGLSKEHEEEVPTQKVRTHFLPTPDQREFSVELLESLDEEGPIGKAITKRGPGVHHLAFELDPGELASKSDALRDAGFKLIYDEPQAAAHGMRMNFIHPGSTGGVLIEIMEKAQ